VNLEATEFIRFVLSFDLSSESPKHNLRS